MMEQNIIAVSQVNEYIKFLLDRDELLTNLCVRGEVRASSTPSTSPQGIPARTSASSSSARGRRASSALMMGSSSCRCTARAVLVA